MPVEEFENSLMEYVDTAKKAGATAVLVSSITLRPCSETMGNGEALSSSEPDEVVKIARLLPEYGKVMRRLAEREGLLYVDMGNLTRTLCEKADSRETASWYREDNVHLVQKGAEIYAKVFADAVKGSIL